MRIAFTTTGTNWESMMDSRFGRTQYFVLYDDEKDELSSFDNSDAANDAHGAGPKTAQKLSKLDADVLITGNGPGGNAATVLEKTGVLIYVGAGDITAKEAYDKFKAGELQKA